MAKLWVLLRDKFFDNIIKIIGLILLFVVVVVLPYLSEPIKNFINSIPNILLIAISLLIIIIGFVQLTYISYLKAERSKTENKMQNIESQLVNKPGNKFKDWEFLDKYGKWKNGEIYYCPNCRSKEIILH